MLLDKEFSATKPFCHIIGASDFVASAFCPGNGDLVIAADGGFSHLSRLGVKPDIIIGDFDSLGYVPEGAVVLPSEKDDTDTLAAVKIGLNRGFSAFMLHGCLGGRLDHSLANIQVLNHITERGGRGYLVGRGHSVTVIAHGCVHFDKSAMGTVSVFSGGGKAEGVTLHGLKYPLIGYTLTNSAPIGVSNEFIGEESRIEVKSGSLVIVLQDDSL